MALPVGAVEHEKVVSGHDAAAIYLLGKVANSTCCRLALFRLPPFWLGRVVLAWCTANGVLPPHAVLRKQPLASEARIAGRSSAVHFKSRRREEVTGGQGFYYSERHGSFREH